MKSSSDAPIERLHAAIAAPYRAFAYVDPFSRKHVTIRAPLEQFARDYGFDLVNTR